MIVVLAVLRDGDDFRQEHPFQGLGQLHRLRGQTVHLTHVRLHRFLRAVYERATCGAGVVKEAGVLHLHMLMGVVEVGHVRLALSAHVDVLFDQSAFRPSARRKRQHLHE